MLLLAVATPPIPYHILYNFNRDDKLDVLMGAVDHLESGGLVPPLALPPPALTGVSPPPPLAVGVPPAAPWIFDFVLPPAPSPEAVESEEPDFDWTAGSPASEVVDLTGAVSSDTEDDVDDDRTEDDVDDDRTESEGMEVDGEEEEAEVVEPVPRSPPGLPPDFCLTCGGVGCVHEVVTTTVSGRVVCRPVRFVPGPVAAPDEL